MSDIPTLTDAVEEPRNQFHERLLEQIHGPAIVTHYGERPSDGLPAIEWRG